MATEDSVSERPGVDPTLVGKQTKMFFSQKDVMFVIGCSPRRASELMRSKLNGFWVGGTFMVTRESVLQLKAIREQPITSNEVLLTPREVARETGYNHNTISQMARHGRLRSVYMNGRIYIPLDEVEKLVAKKDGW